MILHIGNYKENVGGISGSIEEIVNGLKMEGFNTCIYSLWDYTWFFSRMKKYFFLPKAIFLSKIVHVHCSSRWGLLPVIFSYCISILLNRRIVITYHGSTDNAKSVAEGFFFQKLVSKKIQITTPSSVTTRIFQNSGLNSRVIPNIFNLDQWDYKERKIINPIFICTRSKYNPEIVINTFNKVLKIIPHAELFMLGSFDSLESENKAKKCKSIHVLGNLPRNQIKNYLNIADIYINSCENDSFGYSIFEAIACGLIVVSIHSPSLLEIFGEDIIYFSDKENLEKKILYILHKQNLAQININSGIKKVNLYTWEILKEEWIKIYNEINEN